MKSLTRFQMLQRLRNLAKRLVQSVEQMLGAPADLVVAQRNRTVQQLAGERQRCSVSLFDPQGLSQAGVGAQFEQGVAMPNRL